MSGKTVSFDRYLARHALLAKSTDDDLCRHRLATRVKHLDKSLTLLWIAWHVLEIECRDAKIGRRLENRHRYKI